MIEFCYLIECNEQKEKQRFREQMECARRILEKSTNVLLTAAKVRLLHPHHHILIHAPRISKEFVPG